MDLNIVSTSIGLVTLVPILFCFFMFSKSLPLGALSLPCLTMMTTFVYFYAMPIISLSQGNNELWGMYLTNLEWAHLAVLLYALGASAAFIANEKYLLINPAKPKPYERSWNKYVFAGLWALAISLLIIQISLGKLNIAGDDSYRFEADSVGELAFLTVGYNMMVPLTLLIVIRDDFKIRSLVFLALVLLIFMQIGFRFRILITLCAVVSSYALVRKIKINAIYAFLGSVAGIYIVNLIGAIRRYGQGIDLSRLDDVSADKMLSSFGGEFGIVFTLQYTAANPLPAPAYFEPWTVALARLIPSAIWPNKPTAEYLRNFILGFPIDNADKTGIAAPQQVEMLLQFGWVGLPFLAVLYFGIATFLVFQLNQLSREARIAGCSLVPAFFGYYMQTRGYFFQILADGIFFFLPLFLVHYGVKETSRARTTKPSIRL